MNADRAWLVRKVGAQRLRGPEPTTEPPVSEYLVEVTRPDGKRVWYYGPTPEAALARARSWLERPPENRRVT